MQALSKPKPFADARDHQLLFLSLFLATGLIWLGWSDSLIRIPILMSVSLLTQWLFEKYWLKREITNGLKSALITSLSLCILFRANHPATYALTALIAVSSKFFLRDEQRHFVNPANFGIVFMLLFFEDGWISPGQWGVQEAWPLMIGIPGLMVITKAGRLDTALAFLITLLGLDTYRILFHLEWEPMVLLHKYTTGSLLLFTFFMITDPVSTPRNKLIRILWASCIGICSFYGQSYLFIHTAPLYCLFFFSFLTPILNKIFPAEQFEWYKGAVKLGDKTSNLSVKKIGFTSLIILLTTMNQNSFAFCGFYVSKAGSGLWNNKSEVILVRNGENTCVTMNSDFKGDVKDFAMVVPVPTIIKREDIRIVEPALFQKLDDYSAPRLAAYYDENPCEIRVYEDFPTSASMEVAEKSVAKKETKFTRNLGVTIEAQYEVEEYNILVLSAKESNGLKIWLTQNGYKIPESAERVLDPYIKSNMKFFVVKVNLAKVPGYKVGETIELRPIQISFNSPKFMLPIRLGMANSHGEQDMIVYAFSPAGRIETINYQTKKIPSNLEIPLFVQHHFDNFYSSLFKKEHNKQYKNSVFLEYSWDVTPNFGIKCDPCVGDPPMTRELAQAGVKWLNGVNNQGQRMQSSSGVYFTRLHVRYAYDYFPQDLVFQETSNRENFQARYVIHHPATGDLSCAEGQNYLNELKTRKRNELSNLAKLTGWKTNQFGAYYYQHQFNPKTILQDTEQGEILLPGNDNDQNDDQNLPPKNNLLIGISLILFILSVIFETYLRKLLFGLAEKFK